jgi:hypothetical protein
MSIGLDIKNQIPSWWRFPMRVYQANNFEIDPKEIHGSVIAEQAESMHCNAVIVDAGGGISTFYHSNIKYLTPNPFLEADRDFFAEMAEACRKKNIKVFARNDFGNMSRETANEHPEWAMKTIAGNIAEVNGVVFTCPTGDFFRKISVEAFKEQIERYKVDGIYINALGNRCYCERCKKMYAEKTRYSFPDEISWRDPVFRGWLEFGYYLTNELARVQYEGVKSIDPNVLYFIDSAGPQEHDWIRGKAQDLYRQARYEDIVATEAFNDLAKDYPQMLSSITARYTRHIGDTNGKPAAIFVSAFPGHSWPRSSQPLEEYRSFSAAAFLNGCSVVTPWYGHSGREDTRVAPLAREVFSFFEKHAGLLDGAVPVAPAALVYSRRTADHYGRQVYNSKYMHGFYAACHCLIQEHIPFKIISDEDIENGIPEDTELLIFTNTACLSEKAKENIDVYVRKGLAVIADYETAMFTEEGAPLCNYTFESVKLYYEVLVEPLNVDWIQSRFHSYLEIIDPKDSLFEGLENTSILPFKGPYVRMVTQESAKILCRLTERIESMPPEKGWKSEHLSDPMIYREGKFMFFSFPIFYHLWRYRHPDYRRLIGNAVRSLVPLPFTAKAPSSVEITMLSSQGRLIIGLINHTAGLLRDHGPIPAGPVEITLKNISAERVTSTNGNAVELVDKNTIRLKEVSTYDMLIIEKV